MSHCRCLLGLCVLLSWIAPSVRADPVVLVNASTAVPLVRSSYPSHFFEVEGELHFLGRTEDERPFPLRLYRIDPGTGDVEVIPAFPENGNWIGPIHQTELYQFGLGVAGNRVLHPGRNRTNFVDLWSTRVDDGEVRLVLDTSGLFLYSDPRPLGQAGDRVIVQMQDEHEKRSVCGTDGTPEGTECWPALDGLYYFGRSGADGLFYYPIGNELWTTDGTAAGRALVRTFAAMPRPIATRDEMLVNAGLELWSTDGTEVGTTSLGATPDALVGRGALGSLVFLSDGPELWVADGASVSEIADLADVPGSFVGWSARLGEIPGAALFSVECDVGFALWRSAGTAETTSAITDCSLDAIDELATVRDLVVFAGRQPGTGSELWVSDGTDLGTVLLKEFRMGPEDGIAFPPQSIYDDPTGSSVLDMGVQGGFGYFSAYDVDYGYELWRTDGTALGTTLVSNLAGDEDNPSVGSPLPAIPGAVLFSLDTEASGREMWRADGTENGAEIVIDLQPGPGDGSFRSGFNNVAFGGWLYFRSNYGSGSKTWRTDGSAVGTVELSGPCTLESDFIKGPDEMLFLGRLTGGDFALCRTDGTAPTTEIVMAGLRVVETPEPSVYHGSTAFFVADDGVTGDQIWRSDGTPEGTQQSSSFAGGIGSAKSLTMGGSRALFHHDDYKGSSSQEIWLYDAAGGAELADAEMRSRAEPGYGGGHFLFEPEGGVGIFRTPGTADEIEFFLDPAGVPLPSSMAGLQSPTRVGDRLFFRSLQPDHGDSLWVSDGTSVGTMQLRDPWPGAADAGIDRMAAAGDRLIFKACSPEHGCELWISNGTPGGTRILGDVSPGPESSHPRSLVGHEHGVLFTATPPSVGLGLFWLSFLCGNGVLDAGEACDDGGVAETDGCSSTCEQQSKVAVGGVGTGGSLLLEFDVAGGVVVESAETAGSGSGDAAALLARAVNEESVLVAEGIFAVADGATLYVNAPLTSAESLDTGLAIAIPEPRVPMLALAALWTLGMLRKRARAR